MTDDERDSLFHVGDMVYMAERGYRILGKYWENGRLFFSVARRQKNKGYGGKHFEEVFPAFYFTGAPSKVSQCQTVRQVLKIAEDCHWWPKAVPVPTDAEPGSPKKIEVLRRRVELGQQLWHPLDPSDMPVE